VSELGDKNDIFLNVNNDKLYKRDISATIL